MINYWSTHTLSANSPLLQRIGANPGKYQIKWDKGAGVLRVKDEESTQEWQFPLASANDVRSLFALGSKTRDDLGSVETTLLKQLSDARYNSWTRWKQSNYQVKTKTDSTGFVKDILIRRSGTTGDDDHIHIWIDPVEAKPINSITGKRMDDNRATHLKVIKNGKVNRYEIDKNKSIDDLINEFTQ